MDARYLVALGNLPRRAQAVVSDAAHELGFLVLNVAAADDVASVVGEADVRAMVISEDDPQREAACRAVRSRGQFGDVPIFLLGESGDLPFVELFTQGGDDVVPLSATALVRRVRGLTRSGATSKGGRGRAVVASSNPAWRTVVARLLAGGGYDVAFAVETADAVELSSAEGTTLVVASEDLMPTSGVDAVWAARGRGSDVPWILVTPPKRMSAIAAETSSLARVAVTDAFAPPENVLFVANELGRAGLGNQRRFPRVLFGTTIEFRIAGRETGELGFSYNVSEGGIYVRTCAPLDRDQEAWLEFWPPRTERRVRLAGVVAWRRPFGPSESATVPPGFGVRLTEGLAGDLERYQTGVRALVSMLVGDPVA